MKVWNTEVIHKAITDEIIDGQRNFQKSIWKKSKKLSAKIIHKLPKQVLEARYKNTMKSNRTTKWITKCKNYCQYLFGEISLFFEKKKTYSWIKEVIYGRFFGNVFRFTKKMWGNLKLYGFWNVFLNNQLYVRPRFQPQIFQTFHMKLGKNCHNFHLEFIKELRLKFEIMLT